MYQDQHIMMIIIFTIIVISQPSFCNTTASFQGKLRIPAPFPRFGNTGISFSRSVKPDADFIIFFYSASAIRNAIETGNLQKGQEPSAAGSGIRLKGASLGTGIQKNSRFGFTKRLFTVYFQGAQPERKRR